MSKLKKKCIRCKKVFQFYPSTKRQFCSIKCYRMGWSIEHKQAISKGLLRAYLEGRKKMWNQKGLRNPNWKNGVSDKNHILRTSKKFRIWREEVYKRDKYTCKLCGDSKGGNLHPHHIKMWYKYPKLRFKVSNGITLCKNCHIKIHKGKGYGGLNVFEK